MYSSKVEEPDTSHHRSVLVGKEGITALCASMVKLCKWHDIWESLAAVFWTLQVPWGCGVVFIHVDADKGAGELSPAACWIYTQSACPPKEQFKLQVCSQALH